MPHDDDGATFEASPLQGRAVSLKKRTACPSPFPNAQSPPVRAARQPDVGTRRSRSPDAPADHCSVLQKRRPPPSPPSLPAPPRFLKALATREQRTKKRNAALSQKFSLAFHFDAAFNPRPTKNANSRQTRNAVSNKDTFMQPRRKTYLSTAFSPEAKPLFLCWKLQNVSVIARNEN